MKILVLTVLSLPVLAFVLDLLLGDPRWLPHPVRWIGRAAQWLEPRARKFTGLGLKRAGILCVLLLALCSGLSVHLLSELKFLGLFFTMYFAYAGLALGELQDCARDALEYIEEGDLPAAREAVGELVTRATGHMDEDALRRTLAETVSENFCDGFVAPLFFLVLGGPALLWAYKAVSTLDSMWGYKTEEYQDFGWAAARADDVLAWIPARLTAGLLLLSGAMLGLDWRTARGRFRADAAKMESPNAGWPMAVSAWLVGGSMGGPATYFGVARNKPGLGPEGEPWSSDKLRKLLRLQLIAAMVGVALLQGLRVAVTSLF